MKKFKYLSTIALMLMAQTAFGQEAPVDVLNDYLNEKQSKMVVTNNVSEYRELLFPNQATLERGLVVEAVGYSGVDYTDLEKYKNDLRESLTEIRKSHPTSKSIAIVLGGSTDGFGIAYEVIDEMKKEGKLPNTTVSGMVSDAVLKYLKYDPLSLKQDSLLLFKSYKEGSFELKSSAHSMSQTSSILNMLGHESHLIAFEGGAQSFNEILEHLLSEKINSHRKVTLVVGYDGLKVKNEKSGYRAATQVALALHLNEGLLTEKNPVTVEIKIAGQMEKSYSVSEFFQTPEGKQTLAEYNKHKSSKVTLLTDKQKEVLPAEKQMEILNKNAYAEMNSELLKLVKSEGSRVEKSISELKSSPPYRMETGEILKRLEKHLDRMNKRRATLNNIAEKLSNSKKVENKVNEKSIKELETRINELKTKAVSLHNTIQELNAKFNREGTMTLKEIQKIVDYSEALEKIKSEEIKVLEEAQRKLTLKNLGVKKRVKRQTHADAKSSEAKINAKETARRSGKK